MKVGSLVRVGCKQLHRGGSCSKSTGRLSELDFLRARSRKPTHTIVALASFSTHRDGLLLLRTAATLPQIAFLEGGLLRNQCTLEGRSKTHDSSSSIDDHGAQWWAEGVLYVVSFSKIPLQSGLILRERRAVLRTGHELRYFKTYNSVGKPSVVHVKHQPYQCHLTILVTYITIMCFRLVGSR